MIIKIVQSVFSVTAIAEYFTMSRKARRYTVRRLADTTLCLKNCHLFSFWRLFVKRFALCYRTVVMSVCLPCLSCAVLSVCDVGVLWLNVGWIEIELDMQVGLGPGHIVLDGNPALPSQKGVQPQIFGPCLLWPNGWMDEDATWFGGRPHPRRHCVRWGPSSPPLKGHSPQFSIHDRCGAKRLD